MVSRSFIPVPSSSNGITDKTLLGILEPIRDAVQRRFQGSIRAERAVTRQDLVTLGLVTQKQIEKLKD